MPSAKSCSAARRVKVFRSSSRCAANSRSQAESISRLVSASADEGPSASRRERLTFEHVVWNGAVHEADTLRIGRVEVLAQERKLLRAACAKRAREEP